VSARDQFIDVLRSRGMLRPGEEWVVDANLAAYAHELAEQQRKAIEGFDHDDHWGVLYRPDDVEGLPDLIDPKAQRASSKGDTP
jgi:hypothetical protein